MKTKGTKPNLNLSIMALLVEGGLVVLALFLGWLNFYDQDQPLNECLIDWVQLLFLGTLATLPMLLYLFLFHYWTSWKFIRPMRKFVDTKLRPMFVDSSILELLMISILAGIGEELFFRWCLQGGMTHALQPFLGSIGALIIGIAVASFLFGGCHWVNTSYGVTTAVVGVYFGLTMIWSGSWVVPAFAHATFDFVALIYIARVPPIRAESR